MKDVPDVPLSLYYQIQYFIDFIEFVENFHCCKRMSQGLPLTPLDFSKLLIAYIYRIIGKRETALADKALCLLIKKPTQLVHNV